MCGDGIQEAPAIHIRDPWILVVPYYAFVSVIFNAGWFKLLRVILGQITIALSLCCVDMPFDCLIATGFGSGLIAKAVSLA